MKIKHINESNKIDIDQLLRQLYGDNYKEQIAKGQEIPYARVGDAESEYERFQNQEYHRDQDRLDQLRGFDRLEEEPVAEEDDEYQLNEISNELLQRYKQAAALDAGKADKIAFDPETDRETANQKVKHANKRFSGIMKATKKQFANGQKTNEGSMGGINRSAPAQDVSYEKVLDSEQDQPIEYHLVDGKTNEVIGKYKPEQRGRARARRDKLDNEHGGYRYKVVPIYATDEDTLSDGREYYQVQDTHKYVITDVHTGEVVAGPFSDKQVAIDRRNKYDLKHGGTRYKVEPYRKSVGRPLEEKKPCWKGYKQIGMKDKNGKEVPNCVPVNEADDGEEFKNILISQYKKAGKEIPRSNDFDYAGWKIRIVRTTDSVDGPVKWAAWPARKEIDLSKVKSATGFADAWNQATSFINSGGDLEKEFKSKRVTISFNVHFSRIFGEKINEFFFRFEDGFVVASMTPQEGFHRASPYRGNLAGEFYFNSVISSKEAKEKNLVPHGRYTVHNKESVDDTTFMVRYQFFDIALDKNDKLRMPDAGFTVAPSNEEVNEDDIFEDVLKKYRS